MRIIEFQSQYQYPEKYLKPDLNIIIKMNKKSDLFKIKIGKYQNNIKSNTNVTLCDDHTVTIKYM